MNKNFNPVRNPLRSDVSSERGGSRLKRLISNGINPETIKSIIGLGNPGKQYENTYHNIGQLFIQYLKKELPITNYQLLVTNSFMNESGPAVAKLMKKNGAKPHQIIIVHDDSDLELGKFKIQYNKNSAGHKGVESIIQSLGTKEFWRLRLGIRKPQDKSKAEKFVLKKITAEGKKELEKTFHLLANRFAC